MAGAGIPASIHAASEAAPDSATAAVTSEAKSADQPKPLDPKPEQASSFRTAVRAMVEREVWTTGLPADIADAVVHVESNYDPSTIGSVGEIGLMQIRPETAAMLGFRGSDEELAKPEVNIHYGVIYLSKAWRLANGDLCRALMKYRAGHGEEIMTPRSVTYCQRARNHLAALGSPFATEGTTPPFIVPASTAEPKSSFSRQVKPAPNSPTDVYARYKRGTPEATRAFWAAHEAHVRAVTVQIEARWRRMASR
jgi:soluble lytic murein transglycosylase-like protein